MPKVVFRIAKLKTFGAVSAAAGHNLRTRPTPNAAPGGPSIQVVPLRFADVISAVKAEIGEQTIRKNAVLAVEIVISASPEYFRPDDPAKAGHWDLDRLTAWRKKMEPWIRENFPHAVSVVLHLDEVTPHYQIIDVPLDDKGKLNCRGRYGGKETLARWQDRAAEPVQALGIERGIAGSLAKHERIQAFYRAVNSPVPALPKVLTPEPEPLPEPKFFERFVPSSERKILEGKQRRQQQKRNEEITARNDAAVKHHPRISAKANATDLAQRRQKDAEMTNAKLSAELAKAKQQADKLRALPLPEILFRMYRAVEASDSRRSYASRKFDLPDGRQIAVTGDKWIQQGDKGGKGAINLVMHLDGLDYRQALRLMIEHFDSITLAAEHSRQLQAQAVQEIKAMKHSPVSTPTPAVARWPHVREWLVSVRGMPGKLADWLNAQGLVFADNRGNAVFAREKGGAFVRGTGKQKWRRTIGKAEAGGFVIPGDMQAGIYLVDGPMDAVALKAINPDAFVFATGGNLIPPAEVKIPPGIPVFAAFDNDPAGRGLAADSSKSLKAQRHAPPENVKDWAEAVENDPGLASKTWGEGKDPEEKKVAPGRPGGLSALRRQGGGMNPAG